MPGLDIPTGNLSDHDSSGATGNVLFPYDGSEAPAVMPPTQIVPGQLSGPTVPAMDTTGMFQSQRQAGEDAVAAAQQVAESAEMDRRDAYQAQALPLGGHIGDGMTLPPNPLDPGVGSLGSGETSPFGSFYDPPRPGATETSVTPGTSYLGNTGDQPG